MSLTIVHIKTKEEINEALTQRLLEAGWSKVGANMLELSSPLHPSYLSISGLCDLSADELEFWIMSAELESFRKIELDRL